MSATHAIGATEVQHAEHYARLNFALVPITYGTKEPKGLDWPNNTITDPQRAAELISTRHNIGVEHGKSQTGTFDIDSAEDTALAFEYVGLDLEAILAHPTVCIRGKNAAKPLYNLTGLELPYFKLQWPHPTERLKNGKPKHYTVLELRAGHGFQDLLPPSMHPDGMLYAWEPGPPASRADLLPPPPELSALWQDPERLALMRQACPWREVEAPRERKRTPARRPEPGESIIDAFNAQNSVAELLERYGYTLKSQGRYLAPESSTKAAGAVIYTGQDGLERVAVHNASSPLCQQDALGKTRGVTAFGVWLEYEHGGDLNAAVAAAAKQQESNQRFTFGGATVRVGVNNNGTKSIKDDNKGKSFESTPLALNNEQVDPNRDLASVTKNDLSPPPGPKTNQEAVKTLKTKPGPKTITSPTQESDLGPSDSYLSPPPGPKSFASGTQESDLGPPTTTHAREDENEQRTKPSSLKWGERKRPPPVRWCVHQLFQDNAENLLAGEPGVGKSWLIVDLAVSVATGMPFLNRRTESGPVLFINFDDPTESLVRQFFDMTVRGRGYEPEDVPVHYWQPDEDKPWPSSGIITPEVFDLLKESVKEIKPRLIIVDAYSSAFPSLDGNKGQDVVQAFEALRQLRMAGGGDTCILLVDHTPKATVLDTKRRGVSGSQQKHARVRTVHLVSHVEPSEVEGENVVKWEVFKMNAAPYQEPFGIEREMDTLEGYARLKVRDLPEQTQAPGQSRAIKAALTHLQSLNGQVITRQDLMKAVIEITNVSKRTVKRALEHSDFASNQNVETRQLEGRGSPVGFFWHGETPAEAVDGYEALKQAVRSGKWAIGNLDQLKACFESADAGDEAARAKIEHYLEKPEVKRGLGLDEAGQ